MLPVEQKHRFDRIYQRGESNIAFRTGLKQECNFMCFCFALFGMCGFVGTHMVQHTRWPKQLLSKWSFYGFYINVLFPSAFSTPVCCVKQSGGFYSAEDADSVPASGGPEKREGAFCVWTASEVRELLPDVVEGASGSVILADIFIHHYGVKMQGNVNPEQVPETLMSQTILVSQLEEDWSWRIAPQCFRQAD